MSTLLRRTKPLLLTLIVMLALLAPATALATDGGMTTDEPTPVEQTSALSTDVAAATAAQAYIVQLRADVVLDRFLLERGGSFSSGARQRFSTIINGFTVDLTTTGLAELAADPRVVTIMPDFAVQISTQTVPNGVRRVGATSSSAAGIDGVDYALDIDVAVLDTGVAAHEDLRISGGVDCTGNGSYSDENGHGTHVAGTIAAIDNGLGVVGVAPGARIWAVKVMGADGNGSASSILCGIDWVTANAATIEIANMSLGGGGYLNDNNCGYTNGDIVHQAICRSVAAGITYVVAAGNDGKDAAQYFPANYAEVITVSALVDTDGQPGGLGPSTSVGGDDTLASFSNYGAAVDLIAPGVLIDSTAIGGGYATMSGTSMAAPHVAGAAALYKLTNPGASPAAIRAALIASGNSAAWAGDRDSFKEPLVNVAGIGAEASSPPSPETTTTVDAQVLSVVLPAAITRGTTTTVTVLVRNNGAASATFQVALIGAPNGFNETKTVAVGAGFTSSITFSWTSSVSTVTGAHTFTATTTLPGDGNSGNNSASATTNVFGTVSALKTMTTGSRERR